MKQHRDPATSTLSDETNSLVEHVDPPAVSPISTKPSSSVVPTKGHIPPLPRHSKDMIPLPAVRSIRPKHGARTDTPTQAPNDSASAKHPHQHAQKGMCTFADPRLSLRRTSTPSTPTIIGSRYDLDETQSTNASFAAEAPPNAVAIAELVAASKRIAQEVRAIHELVDSYDRSTVEDAVMVLAQLQHRMERRSLQIAREVELLVGAADASTASAVGVSPKKSLFNEKEDSTIRPPFDTVMFHKMSVRPADVSPVPCSTFRGRDAGLEDFMFATGSIDIGSDGDVTEYPDPSLSFFHEETDDEDY